MPPLRHADSVEVLGRVKTVSVDAEIEDVFGPRVFTIDEPNWGDLQGEILVYVPTTLAARVREDDRITVTGTVKPFVRAEVEREWGWLRLDREVEVEFSKKPGSSRSPKTAVSSSRRRTRRSSSFRLTRTRSAFAPGTQSP